jgi:hypothetical protein
MVYTYSQLKAALELGTNPLLSVFERYCQDMRSNTRVLEWSCKIAGSRFEGARFLHTSLLPEFREAEVALDRVYSHFFPDGDPPEDQNLFFWLRPLAQRVGDGIILAYGEQGEPEDRSARIELYVKITQVDAVRPLVELMVPKGADPPVRNTGVGIAASIDDRNRCGFCIYYLWTRTSLESPEVQDWLKAWCTSEEVRLLNSSRSGAMTVAFKNGERGMLCLRAPVQQPEIDALVLRHLEKYPLAFRQSQNLRWVGFSKGGEGLECRELNAYFDSALD